MDIRLKRAHEPVASADGFRVLIDRLWPRGISRERARLDAWEKELAPSTEAEAVVRARAETLRGVSPALHRGASGPASAADGATTPGARGNPDPGLRGSRHRTQRRGCAGRGPAPGPAAHGSGRSSGAGHPDGTPDGLGARRSRRMGDTGLRYLAWRRGCRRCAGWVPARAQGQRSQAARNRAWMSSSRRGKQQSENAPRLIPAEQGSLPGGGSGASRRTPPRSRRSSPLARS